MSDETEQLQGGRLLVEVSNRFVSLFRDFAGKGPSACKSYWAGSDLVVVLLRGGFTIAEQTLYAGGHESSVRDSRHALQDTLEGRMTDIIEELTRRKVVAFMSASHQDPDLQVELLLLEPEEAGGETDDILSR